MRSRVLAVGCVLALLVAGVILYAPWIDDARDHGSVVDRSGEGTHARLGDVRVEPSLRGSGATPTHVAPRGPPVAPGPPAGFESKTGRIVGRLTDVEGGPVADARIVLRSAAWKSETEPEFGTVVATDADGWFCVDGVPDAEKPYRAYVMFPDGRQARWLGRPGDVPATLVLVQTFEIAGRLVPESQDVPVAGVTLLFRPEGAARTEGARVAVTDAEGRFRADSLSDALHVLTLQRVGRTNPKDPTTRLEPVRIEGIEAGTEDLEVVVRIGKVIAGELRGPDGSRVTHPVAVELLGRTPHGDTDYSRRLRATVTDGTFRFTGLSDGEYLLTFEPKEDPSGEIPEGIAARTIDRVLAGTESLVVDLWGGDFIHGYLIDDEGRETKATGTLYVHPAGTPAGGPEAVVIGMHDESRFRSAPLDSGRVYDILVSGFEGAIRQHVRGVRPGAHEIVIRLERARRIEGRVVSADGSSLVPFIPVTALAAGDARGQPGSVKTTYADAEGRFTVDGLGAFDFLLQAGGSETGRVGVGPYPTVSAGATDVVVKVKEGVPFSGRLVDEAGKPVKTSYLSVNSLDGVGGIASTTRIEGEDGRFVFAGVPRGRVLVVARLGGAYVRLGEFVAPASDVTVRVP